MDQQQEIQEVRVDEGIDLLAIFKLLLSKIKLLIIAFLIGGVLGSCFAVWKTINVNHYGTRVEFYVNPEKEKDALEGENGEYGVHGAYGKSVMDGMIKLLSSESFAEKMILNGADLPEKDVWVNDKAENEVGLDLNTKIDAVAEKLTVLNAEKETLEKWEKELEALEKTRDELWLDLYYDKIVLNPTPSEQEYRATLSSKVDADGDKSQPAAQAYKVWADLDEKIEEKKEELEPVQLEADEILEVALEAWRQTAKYKEAIVKYSGALDFSYLKDSTTADEARSFIYVTISVLNEVEFAEELLNRVKTVVPTYIEQKMTVPDGYARTNCERITRTDDVHLTNPGYTTQQAIKYGVLAAFAALVVVCAVVILVDRTDKRLRDISTIAQQFRVPVLGLIPTIEETDGGVMDKKERNGEETK